MAKAAPIPPRRLLSRRNTHRAARFVLGGGSILFTFMATTQSERVAQVMDTDEDEVRRLAMRNLSSAIAMFSGNQKLRPLLGRLRHDIGDTFRLLRKRPALAPGAMLFVVAGVVAILTRD